MLDIFFHDLDNPVSYYIFYTILVDTGLIIIRNNLLPRSGQFAGYFLLQQYKQGLFIENIPITAMFYFLLKNGRSVTSTGTPNAFAMSICDVAVTELYIEYM